MAQKILHVVNNDKFIAPFINFIHEYQFSDEHTFLNIDGVPLEQHPLPKADNVIDLNIFKNKYIKIVMLLKHIHNADKVILHSLFNIKVVMALYIFPWYLKKCYWVIWGGDLYSYVLDKDNKNHKLNERLRKKVISKMGGFITYIKGDYELAQRWYGTQGKLHECLMYPSNLYKDYVIQPKQHSTINIQVGNSSDPTNNHLEIFEKLQKYKDNDIRVIVPLSYGNPEYAREVIKNGKNILGDKFIPITEYMPPDEYLDFLSEIDIAIFNHERQQAMGNIITLLGLGKKVYIRNNITTWNTLKETRINIYDVANFTIDLLDSIAKQQNTNIIKERFSEETLKKQLDEIFK